MAHSSRLPRLLGRLSFEAGDELDIGLHLYIKLGCLGLHGFITGDHHSHGPEKSFVALAMTIDSAGDDERVRISSQTAFRHLVQ